MLNTALFVQKVVHLLKYWEKKKIDYACNEEDASSLRRDTEVVLHRVSGHTLQLDFKASRLARTPRPPAPHSPALDCLLTSPSLIQSPGDWSSETLKQILTLSHCWPSQTPGHSHRSNPHASTPSSVFSASVRKGELHEFSAANNCSQSWHAIAIHKQFYLHTWISHAGGASKPWWTLDNLINNCTRSPQLQKESALRHRACSGWSRFWPAECLQDMKAVCWFYPYKQLDCLDSLNQWSTGVFLHLLWSYWIV